MLTVCAAGKLPAAIVFPARRMARLCKQVGVEFAPGLRLWSVPLYTCERCPPGVYVRVGRGLAREVAL